MLDYNHITNFLDKFKKLIYQKEAIKEIIIETISGEVHRRIEKDSVKIKNGIIYISGSPVLRSEIMVHKNNILNKLKIVSPGNIFLDIK